MTYTKEIYKEICFVFARLGLFAFGGPAAHIAMMEDELVTKREWLKKTEFMDLLGFTNLIPGPNSTELAIALGYKSRRENRIVFGGHLLHLSGHDNRVVVGYVL